MRAHEFLTEQEQRPPISLERLNAEKRRQRRIAAERQWKIEHLYPAMYGHTDRDQELIALQSAEVALQTQELEYDRLKAEFDAFKAEQEAQSRLAVDEMADDERERRAQSAEHMSKLANREMRRKKP